MIPSHVLRDARVYWSFIGLAGAAVAVVLTCYAAEDRRNAIRGTGCCVGAIKRFFPRFLCVDLDNARDVQSWTSLRRTVADVVIQVGMLAVRAYAITWSEPSDPVMIWQRCVGGWVTTAILVYIALVGLMDYRDRRRLVSRLRRHPDGDCPACGKRVAEDDLYCSHCGTSRVQDSGRP